MSRIPFTLIYLVLLFGVAIGSWVGSVYTLDSEEAVVNLLSDAGVRWMVRHCVENITAAPIAEVLLVLLMIGAVKQSELPDCVRLLVRERTLTVLSQRQGYALRISFIVLGFLLGVLLLGIVPPWGNLLSVTGSVIGGPLSGGWLFVLSLLVCIPSLCYGCLNGVWHTEREVLQAFTSEVSRCSCYFVTLIVAAQIVAAVQYTQLLACMGWVSATLLPFLLYGMPFLAYFVGDNNVRRELF